MLYFLHEFSQSRKSWVILVLSALILISLALFIQYFFLLKPCVLCIYQRCALFGIVISGFLGLIAPHSSLRFLSILIWMYSSFTGLNIAKKNINIVLHPSPFYTCDLFVTFPNWIPLHRWWPDLFNSDGGNCIDYKLYFLSFEISQWMFIFFFSYLLLSLCVMIAQFINIQK